MKLMSWFKNIGVMSFVLILAVGCATPQKVEPPVDNSERLAAAAIASAQSAIEEAAALGVGWRDAQSVLDEAKAAYDAGDYAKAEELANKAQAMAREAIASREVPTERPDKKYEVVAGDNLWDISGAIYDDAFSWPLIYKANRSQIKDADLIYPGQIFNIDTSPLEADCLEAIQHARTRGAWSVGEVEASDEAFLSQ